MRKSMKQKVLLICLVFIIGILGACGNSSNNSKSVNGGEKDGDWTIALVPKDSTNAWFVRMEEGVKEYAQDTDLNVFQKGPSSTNAAEQVKVVEDLVAQGVDAIAIVPVDPSALEPVLSDAIDKGIVVVSHEGTTLENTMYNIEAFDNKGYGAFIMDNLASAMNEEGKYTTMVGHVTNASHNEWADAAVERQKEAYPNMELIEGDDRVESEDNQERAYERAKELFKKYPDLKGIVGTASKDAPGIAKAIDELNLIDQKFTVGTGMPSESIQYLESGAMSAATLWDPKDAGYALLTLATKVLDGEEIENGLDLGVEGYTDMQFEEGSDNMLYGEGWIEVTAENAESFGF